MARGNTPRQPSRSGRHEGARPHRAAKPLPGRSRTPVPLSKPVRPKANAKKKAASNDLLAPERVRAILAGLDQMYPGVTCALTHRNAWELVVATILSAQCTDVRVNMVTPVLFEKYPTVQH